MKDIGSEEFSGFNGRQQITATSTFMAAMSAIRLDTLDVDIGDRLAHVVMLLGSRSIMASGGFKLKTMTTTRLNEHIRSSFDVSDTAAEGDIKKLKELGITTCIPDPNDGRVRIVVLSETGEALYQLLANRMANLILASAEMLRRDGPAPRDPVERISGFVMDFARRVRSVVGALALAALAVPATPEAGVAAETSIVHEGGGHIEIASSLAGAEIDRPPLPRQGIGLRGDAALLLSAPGSLGDPGRPLAVPSPGVSNPDGSIPGPAVTVADVRKFYEDGLTER